MGGNRTRPWPTRPTQLRALVKPCIQGQHGHPAVRCRWVRKCQLQQLRQDDAQYYPRGHGKQHSHGCTVSVDVAGGWTDRMLLELEDGLVLSAPAGVFPAWMAPYLEQQEDGDFFCTVLYGRELTFARPEHKRAFLHPWGDDALPRPCAVRRHANKRRLAFPQQRVRPPCEVAGGRRKLPLPVQCFRRRVKSPPAVEFLPPGGRHAVLPRGGARHPPAVLPAHAGRHHPRRVTSIHAGCRRPPAGDLYPRRVTSPDGE